MTSTAYSAQGSTLQVDDSTPGTADVVIANIVSFEGFNGEAGEFDISNLSSQAKEFGLGLQDFGTFTSEWHPDLNDAGQTVCRAAQASAAVKTFLLTLPNADTVEFQGIVKAAQAMSGAIDAAVTGSLNIKITGVPTFTNN